MMNSAVDAWCERYPLERKQYAQEIMGLMLKAAVRWMANNPLVPSDESAQQMLAAKDHFVGSFEPVEWIRWGGTEWQRRMFLAPEPVFPKELEAILLDTAAPDESRPTRQYYNARVIEAYHLGKRDAK